MVSNAGCTLMCKCQTLIPHFNINQNVTTFIIDDDDDVGLHVLGCRVDILGTNCKSFKICILYSKLF